MILETKNLWLKTAELEDANKLHSKVWSDYDASKADVWKPSQKLQDSEKFMKTMFATKNSLFFTIVKKETKEQIGFITITKNKDDDSIIDNIGLSFSSTEAHKGYGVECLLIVIEFCFSKLDVKQINISYLKSVGISNNIKDMFGFVESSKGITQITRKYTNEKLDVVNLVLTKKRWDMQKVKFGVKK